MGNGNEIGFKVDEREQFLIKEAYEEGIRGIDAMIYAWENYDRKDEPSA